MARSLRSISGSGLTAAPTPRSMLVPPMKARACHHPSRQRQPSLTCDPVSNHAGLQVPCACDHPADHAVRDRLLSAHPVVAVGVAAYLLIRLACLACDNAVDPFTH